jgi:hypothetical protein
MQRNRITDTAEYKVTSPACDKSLFFSNYPQDEQVEDLLEAIMTNQIKQVVAVKDASREPHHLDFAKVYEHVTADAVPRAGAVKAVRCGKFEIRKDDKSENGLAILNRETKATHTVQVHFFASPKKDLVKRTDRSGYDMFDFLRQETEIRLAALCDRFEKNQATLFLQSNQYNDFHQVLAIPFILIKTKALFRPIPRFEGDKLGKSYGALLEEYGYEAESVVPCGERGLKKFSIMFGNNHNLICNLGNQMALFSQIERRKLASLKPLEHKFDEAKGETPKVNAPPAPVAEPLKVDGKEVLEVPDHFTPILTLAEQRAIKAKREQEQTSPVSPQLGAGSTDSSKSSGLSASFGKLMAGVSKEMRTAANTASAKLATAKEAVVAVGQKIRASS